MFTESADLYDLIYSFKDYQKESEEIISAISTKKPGCKSILDVGCGIAEHHKYLKDKFQIDGLDINGKFIESAKAKNQSGSYYVADMTETYDEQGLTGRGMYYVTKKHVA